MDVPDALPSLQTLREELEDLDREILALLRRRMERVEAVAQAKLGSAFPFRDQQREDQVLQRVRRAAVGLGLDAHAVERLYRLIMEMSISHQQAYVRALETVPLRVAYQGVEGSYSHLTAQRRYAGRRVGALLSGYETVREAGEAVRSGTVDVGLLPIENSTAGSVGETYDQLAGGGLTINAEVVSAVEHCLLTLPGVALEELRRVLSHPQALAQCEDFLRTIPWAKPVAEFDTAGAARKIKQENDRSVAAIASAAAGEMLGLAVARRGIQSQPGNATRFVEVAIEAAPCPADSPCKTSILATLGRDAATLGELLTCFGRRGIALARVESRPIPASAWRYRFYLDLLAHAGSAEMTEALDAARSLCEELRILGTYPRAGHETAPAAAT